LTNSFVPLTNRLPPAARLVSVRSGRQLDAAGLVAAVAAASRHLESLGLAHGDRVVIGHADPLDFIVSLLAAWQAGLVGVGVNPKLSALEQDNVIATAGASGWLGELRTTPPAFEPVTDPATPLGTDEPALILMTSGTTGRPKGIALSQAALLARVEHNRAAIPELPLPSLCVLPVFFGHGLIGNVLTPLLAGSAVHLWPSPDAMELRGFGQYLDNHRIGFMSSVPAFWKLALRFANPPAQPLVRVHVGSSPLSREHWEDIASFAGTRNVFNMFGMTETANWIAGGTLDEPGADAGYVGKPWGGEIAVLGEDGGIAPTGRGEVLVRSPSIMAGYWQRPDLDAEAFVADWFRTGDIGELDAEGRLTLVGRIKTEINRGGIKVQAEEIDLLLERHPDIAEACAFGMPDPIAGELVAAAIAMKPGKSFDPEAIKAWCRGMARSDAVPSRLFVLDAIPRNERGKLVRADVRRIAEGSR
jgi:acyl-CoA synthetase (AMP-forming)/AMP-acid ligase II